jgi:hypothetical protein
MSVEPWLQLGASILNTGSQVYTNAKNRKWALQDWERQNAYNAPAQQMQRYKEAGLNPNLIYKQTNESGPVRSTDAIAPKLDADALGILGKSNKLKLQDLSMQTAAAQLEATKAQVAKTNAEETYIRSNTDWRNLQNEIGRGTKEQLMAKPSIENNQSIERTKNIQADTNLKVDQLSINSLKKDELKGQIERITTSNEFIRLEKNQQLAVQRAMIKSINAATDLTKKKYITEDFNQQNLYKQILTPIKKDLQDNDLDMSWVDKVIGIGSILLPYNMGKILPRFNAPK